MAVFHDAVGPGDYASTPLGDAVVADYRFRHNGGMALVPIVFSASDLALGPFVIGDNDLNDLNRRVTLNDVDMVPLGPPVQWGTMQAWTEVFALPGVPAGEAKVWSRVRGGAPSKRALRVGGATYSGVDGVGTPVTGAAASATEMSISATAGQADRLVGIFGTRDGISNFNKTQRSLSNSGIGLLIGDAAGTASSDTLTATRQKAGAWGGMVIPLVASPTVITCPPLVIEPIFGRMRLHREPRLGGLRRQVFRVPLESSAQDFIDIAEAKAPSDITPITLDWEEYFDGTADRIRDGVIVAEGLEIQDDWFTPTDQTVLVGGGSDGTEYTITYHAYAESGEVYTRSIKLPVRNL